MKRLHAELALLPDGFARDVLIAWDEQGRLTEVQPDAARPEGAERIAGLVVPGLPNLHSHAFQRAFAGAIDNGCRTRQRALQLADPFAAIHMAHDDDLHHLCLHHAWPLSAYALNRVLTCGPWLILWESRPPTT